MSAALAIAGLGAVTPVGLSAASTCAALRAGIARLDLFEGWTDSTPVPDPAPVVGRVPLECFDPGAYPDEWPGHERMRVRPPVLAQWVTPGHERLVEFGRLAAAEAWTNAGASSSTRERTGLYVGIDEHVDGEALLAGIAAAIELAPDVRVAVAHGRASALEALHLAARDLASGSVTRALVGGVDSLLRRAAIDRLGAEGALLTEKNSSGHPVGEGAAFVVLERPSSARRALAVVGQTAIASEPTARTDQPCEAVALSRVIRELRRSEPANAPLPRLICDLNGDRYRATEWLLASTRALAGWEPAATGARRADLLFSADRIGDVGAASGAIGLVWAVSALGKGYARADRVLVFGASDGPLRAGAIVRKS